MKAYRGKIKVKCKKKVCPKKKTSIDHNCMNCEHRSAELIDLKDKTLFVFDKIVKKKTIKKEK
jgi:hypothetical protein